MLLFITLLNNQLNNRNMTTEQTNVEKFYAQHPAEVEINQLKNKYLPLAVEYANLLKELDVKSIAEFEFKLNEKSGFVSARLSAEAYGMSAQYERLLQLEKLLDGKLSLEDLTKQNEIKLKRLDEVRCKHTTYFTKSELEQRNKMQKAIDSYNDLDVESRQRLIIDRQYKMQFNPFIRH